MKTFWKILGGIAVVFLVLIIGVNLYFTNERLKNVVVPVIEHSTGQPVKLESISLTFFSTFPQPGISLRHLSVEGQTPDDTLLSMNKLVLSVRLFSLFGDEIRFDEIFMERPRFTYRVFEDGGTNIDFLYSETGDSSGSSYRFNIPNFEIVDGQFGYENHAGGHMVSIDSLDASISLNFAELVKSNTSLKSEKLSVTVAGTQYVRNLPVRLNQHSTIDLQNKVLAIDEGSFSIRGLALNLDGTVKNWDTTPYLDLVFASSSDNFGELLHLAPESYSGQLQDLVTNGSLTLNGRIKGAAGDSSLPSLALDAIVKNGYLKFPEQPKPVEDIQLEIAADNSSVTVKRFRAVAGENHLEGESRVDNPFNDSERTIDFNANLQFDLSTLKNFYPVDEDLLSLGGMLTAHVAIRGRANRIAEAVREGNISLKDGYFDYKKWNRPFREVTLETILEGAQLTILEAGFRSGGNRMNASGIITNYLSKDRSVNLQFEGDALLDEISNYYDLKPNIDYIEGTARMNLQAKGPVDTPSEMKFNGSLTVENMNMDGPDSLGLVQPVQDLNGTLELEPGKAALKDLAFRFGSSDFNINGTLHDFMEYLKEKDNRSTIPELSGTVHSRYFNLDELIDWEDTTTTAIPIHLPHLNSSVTATAGEMVITGVSMQNLEAQAATTPKQIILEDARVNLFEGSAGGSFTWNVPDPNHTNIHFNGSLDSLRVSRFFREYDIPGPQNNIHKYISGGFSTRVRYYTELDQYLEPQVETTEMDGVISMTQSRIKEHPVQVKTAEFLKVRELRNLALDRWNSTFKVENSVMSVDSLTITSSDIGVGLSGTRHLVNTNIDYQIRIYLPGRYKEAVSTVITTQATEALTLENGTIMVPLRVTGTMEQPVVKPDQEVIRPIIEQYLKDKAGSVLKKLFGGNKK